MEGEGSALGGEIRAFSCTRRDLRLSFNAKLSWPKIWGKEVVRSTPLSAFVAGGTVAAVVDDGGVYKTNSRSTRLKSALACIRAATSFSDLALCISARLSLERRRFRMRDFVVLELLEDEEVEEDEDDEEDSDEVEAHARAQ